jgi:phage shock protein C
MSQLNPRPAGGPPKKFGLDRNNGKIGGVCAGIARYFGIDPMIVRLVFAIGTIVGFGSFVLIYLAIWLLAD